MIIEMVVVVGEVAVMRVGCRGHMAVVAVVDGEETTIGRILVTIVPSGTLVAVVVATTTIPVAGAALQATELKTHLPENQEAVVVLGGALVVAVVEEAAAGAEEETVLVTVPAGVGLLVAVEVMMETQGGLVVRGWGQRSRNRTVDGAAEAAAVGEETDRRQNMVGGF
ncbi:unnamed protein product [Linum tenue]|uniref:Uncharacterized protein n=1 Tax=Linum tenue TaxID=586396 RepID=A0AAV0H7M3_9ROSI|nr:unnamed protein product [Linum tenue]